MAAPQSTKPFSEFDANQVLQKAASNDSTLAVNGFVNNKVGHKITRTIISSTIDDMRFLDVIQTKTGTTSNGSAVIAFPNVNLLDFAKVGQYVFGAGIPANATVLSVDSNTQITISANATASASVSIKFANLLCRLRIEYSDASHTDTNDVERLD